MNIKTIKKDLTTNEKTKLIFLILILVAISFFTRYQGTTDIADYIDTAKFFSGNYAADIRSSHSYLYGYLHQFGLTIFDNLIIFKITSIFTLILLIYSVFYISNYNKNALWLITLSPIVWYMAPWISPIQLSSLFMLWSWYFIDKFDNSHKIKHLFLSGIFLGLGWAIWDTILFFIFALSMSFLYNKKLLYFLLLIIFIFIGLAPRLILDYFLFNFPFFTILKSTFGTITNVFGAGIYGIKGTAQINLINILLILLTIPISFFTFYKKQNLNNNKKSMIFLTISLIIVISNPQIRYLLILVPIMIVLVVNQLNKNQFKKQIFYFILLSFIFVIPYLIQISYHIGPNKDGSDIILIFQNKDELIFSKTFPNELILTDINSIVSDHKRESFVVGNSPDTYNRLARLYYGGEVEEFVSIQDYNLWLNNESIIYSKEIKSSSNILNRRLIWFKGGISKNPKDLTSFTDINYAITINEDINLINFKKVKEYNLLILWEKTPST